MHFQLSTLALTLLTSHLALAAVNEPCYGPSNVPGVCVSESTCTSSGGTFTSGGCPSDPANIKCCTKPRCGASPGNCRWISDCVGSSLSNQCPGPGGFKCCQSAASGWGKYPAPSFPGTSGGCKQVAIDGAKWVVGAWPGRVRQIYCTRDCACGSNPSSDHCCGKAIDFMCSDAGGSVTSSGREIAEWVMRNRAGHNVKYVIWGQRIWQSGDTVEAWTGWKPMEDRKSITQNHWDHVHVSFN